MIKRNFGPFLKAKTHHGRMRDLMLKVLTHNLALALAWVFYRAGHDPLFPVFGLNATKGPCPAL